MSEEAPLTPTALSGRLEQALDLVSDEAIEILRKGRDPRAFQKVEKLLAIARALRLEMGERVEHVDKDVQNRGPNIDPGTFVINGDQGALQYGGNPAHRPAHRDFQREEKLAQIEAVTARRRRDEAETRFFMVQELERLSKLDTVNMCEEIGEGIQMRIGEIVGDLATLEPNESEDS